MVLLHIKEQGMVEIVALCWTAHQSTQLPVQYKKESKAGWELSSVEDMKATVQQKEMHIPNCMMETRLSQQQAGCSILHQFQFLNCP